MNDLQPGQLMPLDEEWKLIDTGFVYIPAGEFLMGSENGFDDEKPVHKVVISNSFEMGKFQVTQQAWKAITGNNPSFFRGKNLPVECVSWLDVQDYIHKLNEKSKNYFYRLPTEAEWEYACRAGTTGEYIDNLDEIAWYGNNSGNKIIDAAEVWRKAPYYCEDYGEYLLNNGCKTHKVGQKRANAWGLYDMLGNVFEWCFDWYKEYSSETVIDPIGAISGSKRVARGGSWICSAEECLPAKRFYYEPTSRYHNIGFRLVRITRALA